MSQTCLRYAESCGTGSRESSWPAIVNYARPLTPDQSGLTGARRLHE